MLKYTKDFKALFIFRIFLDMRDDYYRFEKIDALLNALKSAGVITSWHDGFTDYKDEFEELVPSDLSEDNPDLCTIELLGSAHDDSGVFISNIPKRLFLRLFDIPPEDIPKVLVLLPKHVHEDTWEHAEEIDKLVKALVRRAAAAMPLWGLERSHRESFLKVPLTVLGWRLSGTLV